MYQVSGLVNKYKQDKPVNGRYDTTKRERDKNVYKVPSLRNIELTAPYFHNGKVDTLRKAVELMIKHQVGFPLGEKETDNIIKFLTTLTGESPTIMRDKK